MCPKTVPESLTLDLKQTNSPQPQKFYLVIQVHRISNIDMAPPPPPCWKLRLIQPWERVWLERQQLCHPTEQASPFRVHDISSQAQDHTAQIVINVVSAPQATLIYKGGLQKLIPSFFIGPSSIYRFKCPCQLYIVLYKPRLALSLSSDVSLGMVLRSVQALRLFSNFFPRQTKLRWRKFSWIFRLMEGVILWSLPILEHTAFTSDLANGLAWAELFLLLKDCITWHVGDQEGQQ